MPILQVQVTAGRSQQQKTAFLQNATKVIEQTLNAALPSIRISLHEIEQQDSIVAGQVGAEFVNIVAFLLAGRNDEVKANFLAAINKTAVTTLDVSDSCIRTMLIDIAPEHMGVQEGLSAAAFRARSAG
ncbi:tautomerase family protein [Advenella mimigardefordensis]|uniref:Putative tautomerase n=1 Tax=Advenella mimigardefordensis (strain DSM 17166 / LMG 22922 / DPN7) TaxID=1247726 RepID=W0PD56_ADVMD|nr:tautomerase family protein [Advenella mimigardefordensis]6VVW_A Chain A, Tautomerase [Advenella mimigardefordensis DPN7]6VVW_B Chain B, Tautomerase [Advenella mimigardefordensis DPN7]6VVW_C Chain C, Tautomerase [Advenella mimigardefordensis DPN7]6VVW_D Chain D, Tautomerase [Advenella mimigardefordensis DPN7]6VVW_E Chain E, Tautomerase [Advenella mimigardefordensis DPN7]6VVW_F Chain F, Tautomerase [Advenella mimigardefordensis DPN7]6VVW_G Chain G, Tautomerase [Advenella mimigardefordensis 